MRHRRKRRSDVAPRRDLYAGTDGAPEALHADLELALRALLQCRFHGLAEESTFGIDRYRWNEVRTPLDHFLDSGVLQGPAVLDRVGSALNGHFDRRWSRR